MPDIEGNKKKIKEISDIMLDKALGQSTARITGACAPGNIPKKWHIVRAESIRDGLVAAGVPVGATQVQLSLLDRRPESTGLSAFCAEHGIAILPYGVLAGGLLSDRYLGAPPPSGDPAAHETRSLTKYLLIVDEAGGWARLQALLRRLRAVADRAGPGATIAAVAVAWALSRPAVQSVIIGARGVAKIEATLACAALQLSPALLDECSVAAEETLLPVPGEVYALERDREGRHGRIMRYNLQNMRGEAYVAELEERAAAALDAFEAQRAAATGPAARCVATRRLEAQAAALCEEAGALRSRREGPEVRRRAAAVARRMRAACRQGSALR